MKKNFIEKFGESIRKNREDYKKESNRYWKLSANERMHYDMKIDNIEERRYEFGLIFRMMFSYTFIVPVCLILAGVLIGKFDILFNSASKMFISLIKCLPFVFIIDMFFYFLSEFKSNKKIKCIKKRFKLIK